MRNISATSGLAKAFPPLPAMMEAKMAVVTDAMFHLDLTAFPPWTCSLFQVNHLP